MTSHYVMEEFKILYSGEDEKDNVADSGHGDVIVSKDKRNVVDLDAGDIIDSESNAIADEIS